MAWKYIIIQVGNREVPVLFPDDLVHSLMAGAMKHYFITVAMSAAPKELQTLEQARKVGESIAVVSAGEVRLDIGPCSGKSDSIGIASREQDRQLMDSYQYHRGYTG